MRKYLILLTAGLSLAACADTLADAQSKVAAAGYSNPTCVHSYIPNSVNPRAGDAKGQFCTASDGRTAWHNNGTVTEAK